MIPITTLERQNKIIRQEINNAISEAIDSGVFILGAKVAEFEKRFAEYLGVKYAIGVASGTDAISLSLLALGLQAGDEVIMPANSYPSVFALTQIGIIPRLVDIDFQTFTIDPSKIEKVITKKTKAILPVHMYGQPADMEAILSLGKKYGIPIVEDCAQGHGAEIRIKKDELGMKKANIILNSNTKSHKKTEKVSANTYVWKKVGGIGSLGCFSFYPTKNLGCLGDGGMVVTNSRELAEKVKLQRMYGEERRYKSILVGRNSRLDELQAAILLVKLKYLDSWNNKRRQIANSYTAQLLNCSSAIDKYNNQILKPGHNFGLPKEAQYAKHIYHLFVIRIKKRDQLKEYLEKNGIITGIHYPTPIHLVPSMKFLGYKAGEFPYSEEASREVLSLPMFPELEEKEIRKITKEINQFCDK